MAEAAEQLVMEARLNDYISGSVDRIIGKVREFGGAAQSTNSGVAASNEKAAYSFEKLEGKIFNVDRTIGKLARNYLSMSLVIFGGIKIFKDISEESIKLAEATEHGATAFGMLGDSLNAIKGGSANELKTFFTDSATAADIFLVPMAAIADAMKHAREERDRFVDTKNKSLAEMFIGLFPKSAHTPSKDEQKIIDEQSKASNALKRKQIEEESKLEEAARVAHLGLITDQYSRERAIFLEKQKTEYWDAKAHNLDMSVLHQKQADELAAFDRNHNEKLSADAKKAAEEAARQDMENAWYDWEQDHKIREADIKDREETAKKIKEIDKQIEETEQQLADVQARIDEKKKQDRERETQNFVSAGSRITHTAFSVAESVVQASVKEKNERKHILLSMAIAEGAASAVEAGYAGWKSGVTVYDKAALAAAGVVEAVALAASQIATISSAATGGIFDAYGPQLLRIGDNGGQHERVSVTPVGSPNVYGGTDNGGSGGITIHVHDATTGDKVVQLFQRALRDGSAKNLVADFKGKLAVA
jgi:hypothetical protein